MVGRTTNPHVVRPAAARLELHGATKTYGATKALRGVSLVLEAGEIRAVVGENGAGKSTLLGILAGRTRPDGSTSLAIDGSGVDLARYSPRVARAMGVAAVRQELAGAESMTVAENIFLGREPKRGVLLDRREMRRLASALLVQVGSDATPTTPLDRLGVAQRQLVEIAKALSFESGILALDEPTTALGDEERERLFAVVHMLASAGVAIAYVSHRLDEVLEHCDTYTVLKDGQVAGSGDVGDVNRRQLVELMVGRELSETYPPRATDVGEARLRVNNLTVPGKLSGISLTVCAGEIVGIAGLMGSGRTTLAKAIFGSVRSGGGSVDVGSKRGPFRSPMQAMRAGIAYVPEDRRREGLAISMSVRANASLLALQKLLVRPWRLISTKAETNQVVELISQLGVRGSDDGSEPVGQLSGGNQQKVVLGKWLLADPSVLILDEPTRGIDVGAKEEIYVLLRRLSEQGMAVLIISSELIELIGLADRILVIADGEITGSLKGADATEAQIMSLATVSTSGRANTSESGDERGD